MSYEPWSLGLTGEGFLVGTGAEAFVLALYRSDGIINPILFILFVTQEYAAGDPVRLFAAIVSDPTGRFMLKVKPSNGASTWRLARGVAERDPRLTWAGPGTIGPMKIGDDLGSAA